MQFFYSQCRYSSRGGGLILSHCVPVRALLVTAILHRNECRLDLRRTHDILLSCRVQRFTVGNFDDKLRSLSINADVDLQVYIAHKRETNALYALGLVRSKHKRFQMSIGLQHDMTTAL